MRIALAGVARGIVSQRLVPPADGLGRCAAIEVSWPPAAWPTRVADPRQDHTDHDSILQGAYYGMQTFDQHLVDLVRDGVVTVDAAPAVASNPHDLGVELRRLGLVA